MRTMNKVWIVLGLFDYSPSTVLKVFADEASANKYKDELVKQKQIDVFGYDDIEVESFEVEA